MFLCLETPMTLLEGGKRYRLTARVTFHSKTGLIISAPKDFTTDLTSCHSEGLWSKPAILHDWMYFCGELTRKESDLIFKEAMISVGVGKFQRNKIYYGVRLFGWKAWNDHRRRNNAK